MDHRGDADFMNGSAGRPEDSAMAGRHSPDDALLESELQSRHKYRREVDTALLPSQRQVRDIADGTMAFNSQPYNTIE